MAPDTNRGGDPQTANQDGRIENQQLPAPNASTPTPGHEGGDSSECGRSVAIRANGYRLSPVPIAPQGQGHSAYRGSAEAQNEQLGCNTPDLHSAETGDSGIHEDRGLGIQRSDETAPERTSSSGHDLRGKFLCSGYFTVRIDNN